MCRQHSIRTIWFVFFFLYSRCMIILICANALDVPEKKIIVIFWGKRVGHNAIWMDLLTFLAFRLNVLFSYVKIPLNYRISRHKFGPGMHIFVHTLPYNPHKTWIKYITQKQQSRDVRRNQPRFILLRALSPLSLHFVYIVFYPIQLIQIYRIIVMYAFCSVLPEIVCKLENVPASLVFVMISDAKILRTNVGERFMVRTAKPAENLQKLHYSI